MRKFIYCSVIAMMINANVVTALASPILPSEDFFIEQNIDMEKVVEKLEDEEEYIIDEEENVGEDTNEEGKNDEEANEEDINEDKIEKIDINDLILVQLSKWFDSIENSTFEEFKTISVEGKEGVEIVIVVYNEEDEEAVVTSIYSQTIGASGMYKEDVSLDYIGKNYVLIITQLDGDIYARQFIINRKDETTKKQLENKVLNPSYDINSKQDNKIEEIKEEIKKETKEEIKEEIKKETKEDMTNIRTEIQASIKAINVFSWVR